MINQESTVCMAQIIAYFMFGIIYDKIQTIQPVLVVVCMNRIQLAEGMTNILGYQARIAARIPDMRLDSSFVKVVAVYFRFFTYQVDTCRHIEERQFGRIALQFIYPVLFEPDVADAEIGSTL